MTEWDDLHALFDAAPDTILVADDERRYVYANHAAEELIGIPTQEILRMRVEDISDAEPEVVRELWESFLARGSLRGEFIVRRPDGTRRTTDFHARANFRPGLHSSILREIDTRGAIGAGDDPTLVQPPSSTGRLERVLDALCGELGWDAANLWLPVRPGAPLGWLAGVPRSLHPASDGLTFEVSDGMVGRVWSTRQPEWIEDVAQERAFLRTEAFTEAGLRTVVGVPLEERGRPVAVLDVASRTRLAPDRSRLEQLGRVGPILAATLTAHWPEPPQALQGDLATLERSLRHLARTQPRLRDSLRSPLDLIGRLAARVGPSMGRLRHRPQGQPVEGTSQDRRVELLTPRERQILGLVADAYTSAEIAAELGITRRTVDTHRTNINRKLGLRSVAALTRFALDHGLTTPKS